jgi:hypothetical protein
MLGDEVLGDFLQRGEMCGCISISKRVVGDEVEAVLEKITQVRVIGGHGKKGRTGSGVNPHDGGARGGSPSG